MLTNLRKYTLLFVLLLCLGDSWAQKSCSDLIGYDKSSTEYSVLFKSKKIEGINCGSVSTSSILIGVPKNIPSKGLVIYLPGTSENPSRFGWLLSLTLESGYSYISLPYENKRSVNSLCADAFDQSSCISARRRVITFGANREEESCFGDYDQVGLECAILNILKALRASGMPALFEKYADSNGINWAGITLFGFSQGAGHALFISKNRAVKRVVLVSGPSDWDENRMAVANWLRDDSKTDLANIFYFYHLGDELVNGSNSQERLKSNALALLGMSRSVPAEIKPDSDFKYISGNNIFYTNFCIGQAPGAIHQCLLKYEFKNMWRHFLFEI